MDENTKRIYDKYGINPEQREKENLEIIENLRNELDEMNEERIRKEFSEGIDENFDNYKPYLRDGLFYLFVEFESNIWQVVQCLTIKAYSASITLTNHIFERIFKLALILNDAGVAPKVVLQATHAACLRIVKLADLKRHAVDLV